MSAKARCTGCGSTLPPNAPSGHCPACLLRIGLEVGDGGLGFGLDGGKANADPGEESSDSSSIRHFGEYELLEEIAHGAMGVVYKARQVPLNRLVALKMIRAGQFANAAEVARFRAEAEAAAALEHPNIVPLYEVGERNGRHYFSMKLMEGGTLSARLSHRPASISPRDAAALVARVARAVHYAHQRGILHRDLKPGNILLDATGEPHVGDFGLAKRIDMDSASTQSGAVVGTPSYIAPEQAAGTRQPTTAVDVYSLGAILYELLTGRPPFSGATVVDTLRRVMSEEPVAPWMARREAAQRSPKSEIRTPKGIRNPKAGDSAEVLASGASDFGLRPSDLDIICLQCLQKDSARRYGSAEALADDLDRWLAQKPIHARPAHPMERFGKWTRRNPILAVSLAVIVLVTTLGTAGIVWQWREAVAARSLAQSADARSREQLWQSLGQQARFSRQSGRTGQRTNALEAIARAAAIRPSLDLRNDAIGALLLPDLGTCLSWKPGEHGAFPWCFDSTLDHHVLHDDSGVAAVYRARDHSLVRELGRGPGRTLFAQFSPDDQYVAVTFETSRGSGVLNVWEWRSGRSVAPAVPCRAGFARATIDFAPDSTTLYYVDGNQGVGRMDLAADTVLPPVLTNATAELLRVSPDGSRLATTRGTRVEVWDLVSGNRLAKADLGAEKLETLVWLPNDGGLVVSSYRTGLHLLRLDGSPPEHFGDAESVVVQRLFFNPTGDLLFAGGWNDRCEIWDIASRTPLLRESMQHGAPAAISRDGRKLALYQERVGLGVWEFFEPTGLRKFVPPLDVPSMAFSLDLHPSGRWLASGHDHAWLIWETAAARVVARGAAQGRPQVKFSPDGTALHTCATDGLKRWPLTESHFPDASHRISIGPPELVLRPAPDLTPRNPEQPEVAPPSSTSGRNAWRYTGAAFSDDGRYVAIMADGYLVRMNLETRQQSTPIPLRRGDGSWSISADGRWFMTAHNNTVGPQLYDLEKGEFARDLREAGVAGGLWQPHTGEFVSRSATGSKFWSPGTWTLNRELPFADPGIGRALTAFAPDGRTGWVAWHHQQRLLDLSTGEMFATFQHPSELQGELVAFDPRNGRVYQGGPHGVIAWDLPALRRELARLGLDWPDGHPSEGFAPRRQ